MVRKAAAEISEKAFYSAATAINAIERVIRAFRSRIGQRHAR